MKICWKISIYSNSLDRGQFFTAWPLIEMVLFWLLEGDKRQVLRVLWFLANYLWCKIKQIALDIVTPVTLKLGTLFKPSAHGSSIKHYMSISQYHLLLMTNHFSTPTGSKQSQGNNKTKTAKTREKSPSVTAAFTISTLMANDRKQNKRILLDNKFYCRVFTDPLDDNKSIQHYNLQDY